MMRNKAVDKVIDAIQAIEDNDKRMALYKAFNEYQESILERIEEMAARANSEIGGK